MALAFFAFTTAAQAAGFEVIGHRGARGLRPENTIPAFTEAVAVGATMVEADVLFTKDHHAIVRHDTRVNDLVCKSGPYFRRFWKNLTLDQVRRLDCGTRNAEDFIAGTQVAVPGAHVPTLAQIYRAVPPRVRILVEAKTSPIAERETLPPDEYAERLVATIRASHGMGRTTVQSFDWGTLRKIARLAPRVQLIGLANDLTLYPGSPWLGGVRVKPDPFVSGFASAADRAGFDGVATTLDKITPSLLTAADERGLDVFPYTIDSRTNMRNLIAAGVDGIISDYPDRLRRVARKAQVRLAR